jgi:hypothetical protein
VRSRAVAYRELHLGFEQGVRGDVAEAGDVAKKEKKEERGGKHERRQEGGREKKEEGRRREGESAHRDGHERLGALRVVWERESVGETIATGRKKDCVRCNRDR